MAFTSYDGIIASLGNGNNENSYFQKASIASLVAGQWYSQWLSAGLPSAGAAPALAIGIAPTAATAGAIKYTNPTGSNTKHAVRFGVGGPTAGLVMLYDRLVTTDLLNGTLTTSQTVNSTALTRSTDGLGVLCAIEVYTALGVTPATATITYTDQDGNTGNVGTISIPASAPAGSLLIPMTMASGDKGVKSVQSVQLSVSTGTAGNFGITLYRPITTLAYNATDYVERDLVLQLASLPTLVSNTCLALAFMATTTSSGIQFGSVGMVEG